MSELEFSALKFKIFEFYGKIIMKMPSLAFSLVIKSLPCERHVTKKAKYPRHSVPDSLLFVLIEKRDNYK